MAAGKNFRSAFNGFNREDVVHYLEYINTRHTAQINQLTDENERLRQKLASAPDVSALEQERDDLLARVAELEQRCTDLEAQSQNPQLPQYSMEQELEVYRRAERAERMAKERAELVYHQTSSVLVEAASKVEALSAQTGPLADQTMEQLRQLLNAVQEGKQSLQDALSLMGTLRPNKD